MTLVDLSLKQGDTLSAITATLTNTDGSAVDLTTAYSVQFVMRGNGQSAEPVVDAAAVIISPPTAGRVRYEWAAGDTDLIGQYLGVFVVVWGDGEQTYPSNGYIHIAIEADLRVTVDDPVVTLQLCSVVQARAITGQDISQDMLLAAQYIIELNCGRQLEDLAETNGLTTRDAKWLRLATAYQSVWMQEHPEIFSATDVTSLTSPGGSAQLTTDGLVIAPLARRALVHLSWMGSRSVRIQRPLRRPTMSTDRIDDRDEGWTRAYDSWRA